MFKTCTKCNKEYPLTAQYWHKKHTNKDGFNARCKECANADDRNNYHNNGYKGKSEKQKEYYQENKSKILEAKEEYRQKNQVLISLKGKKYYQNNKMHIKNYRRKFLNSIQGKNYKKQYDQMRRYKMLSITCNYTEQQWQECKQYFDNRCAYCGEEKELTRDHFIALKHGGEYTKNNIVPACKSCNCSKRTKDFFKWYHEQSFYCKTQETKILKYLNYKNKIQQLTLTI